MSHFAAQASAESRSHRSRPGESRSDQPRPVDSRRAARLASQAGESRRGSHRAARRESQPGPRHSARNHRPAHGERGHYTSLLTVVMFFVAVGITLILPFGQYMGPWLPLLLLGIPFLAGGCGTGCAVHCNRPGWGIANLAIAILYLPALFVLITLVSGP
ncbi:hypothetical protein [Kocuria sp. WRN011]|uniref:hypothetical protein n=1 Tax=Kocuria sp. WRN011 TaxID=2029858 RepID=UPI000BAFD24A|nr:hypothetical protein [Kocuria sp. WRN011]